MLLKMKPSNNGLHLVKEFESCKLVAYDDLGGIPTIGWGHTYGVHLGMTCTQADADGWLQEDYGHAVSTVNGLVIVELTQGEFDALCDFVFNLGSTNFAHSSLLRLLNSGNYSAAALEFDKWDHVAGKVCQGLLRRREEETAEFDWNKFSDYI